MITRQDLADEVRLLTIDRDERRNALDTGHLEQLRGHVADAVSEGVRAVVITGAGSVFSAGADLDAAYDETFLGMLYGTLRDLCASPVPLVAAVNGPAIGAGAQLAMACDLRVGGERARFAVPTARNGLAVDLWTVRRLALLTTGSVARNLLLGAGTLDAEHAHTLGLLGRRGDLSDAVEWAQEIATMAPLSLAYSKRVLDIALEPDVDPEAQAEIDRSFRACWASEDVAEARVARTEKRAPVFRGR
ncbi:putative enoyl-CoA hydratase echA6 [Marmoricola endophyticus]|uniref:Enoyl-CoA hydratase echA6 n=1 Tax=Marmoricola endophyticus TaxID=2040280 RepID=A0A917BM66_9ACTN|nr:enoyl-CoA hydratase [Marmoricola endophyticus]GGF49124.1 putative enoyl-CoA hydratase echA6 [Marmoricola endophyticus]